MIRIENEKYVMTFPDNPEIEKMAADFYHNITKNYDLETLDELVCFVYYMRMCADEFIDLLFEHGPKEES